MKKHRIVKNKTVKNGAAHKWKKVGHMIGWILLFLVLYNLLEPLRPRRISQRIKETTADKSYLSDTEGPERIRCIDENEEALLWRLRMIESAEESIVLSTFDFRADESGSDIISALYEAAQRGVSIKILVDGIYQELFLKRSSSFALLASHEKVQVRYYNPPSLKNIWRLNYRMHDKYLIIDQKMYLLGGRNTNDIFLGKYQTGINIDREILVYETKPQEENSLLQLCRYFDAVWDQPCVTQAVPRISERKKEQEEQRLKERYENLRQKYLSEACSGWLEDTIPVNKITLLSGNVRAEKKAPELLYEMEAIMKQGKDVLIQTPYVICDSYLYQVLKEVSKTAKTEIYLNAVEKGSNPWGCTDYLNQKKKIQKTGVTVYEVLNEAALHTKTILVDDRLSLVGSYNLDIRSTCLDTELMLAIDSRELNARIRRQCEEYQEKSRKVLPDGRETRGSLYQTKGMETGKKVRYAVLRVLTWPIRHLL